MFSWKIETQYIGHDYELQNYRIFQASYCTTPGIKKFRNPGEMGIKILRILGSEQAVIEMLTEGPGALWRWRLKDLEEV